MTMKYPTLVVGGRSVSYNCIHAFPPLQSTKHEAHFTEVDVRISRIVQGHSLP
jgi:hypothetical protein